MLGTSWRSLHLEPIVRTTQRLLGAAATGKVTPDGNHGQSDECKCHAATADNGGLSHRGGALGLTLALAEERLLGRFHLIDPVPDRIVERLAAPGENFLLGDLEAPPAAQPDDGTEFRHPVLDERTHVIESPLLRGVVGGQLPQLPVYAADDLGRMLKRLEIRLIARDDIASLGGFPVGCG